MIWPHLIRFYYLNNFFYRKIIRMKRDVKKQNSVFIFFLYQIEWNLVKYSDFRADNRWLYVCIYDIIIYGTLYRIQICSLRTHARVNMISRQSVVDDTQPHSTIFKRRKKKTQREKQKIRVSKPNKKKKRSPPPLIRPIRLTILN